MAQVRNILFFLFCLGLHVVNASDIQLNVTKTDISCFGKADGSADLFIIGGTAPYEIYFNNVMTQNLSYTGLSKGTYSIKVVDATNQEMLVSFLIEMPKPISVTYGSQTTTSIDNFNARMNIDINGGRPLEGGDAMELYMVRIDSSFVSAGKTISSGDHILTITDRSGCSISIPTSISMEHYTKKKKHSNQPLFSEIGIIRMVIFSPRKGKFNHYEAFKNV